jgi:hypothetical protein
MRALMFALPAAAGLLAACASEGFDKAGFQTFVRENRLWVFEAGSKEAADFAAGKEPHLMVTRVGEGPNGMTMRSTTSETIARYLAAK